MNSRYLYGGLAATSVSLLVLAVALKAPEAPRPGTEHVDNGRSHVVTKKYGDAEPPTSGEHGDTVAWGIHKTEVSDANVLHNLEHGGIYISYRPDTPAAEVAKIEQLFSVPSSREKFSPDKAVVAPRAANKANIIVSSWKRSESFSSFNEEAMHQYYVRNFNKSPEPFGK